MQSLFASALIALLLFTSAATHGNITIDQPVLYSPAKNTPAYPELSPIFQWKAGSSSANLVFDLYLGGNPNQLQLLAENVVNGSFNDSCLIYLTQDTLNLFYFGQLLNRNTTYYWKIVAKDNTGASAASETWAFTTGSPSLYPPDAPVYISPANNTLNISTTPLLQWQESTDPDGDKPVYDVYLSENAAASSLIASNLSTPSFQINTPLKGNTNYSWKVVARDVGGKTATGAIWKFTTQNNAPAPAVLLTPVHQATGTNYNITLTWQKALDKEGDSVYYEVWYGAGAMPDRMQVTGNNNLLLTLAANTVYKWKIVSIDIHGGRTESEIRTFTTRGNAGNTAPAAPSLVMPANSSTGILFQQALQWNAATDNDQDVLSYTVYMGTDGVNLSPVAFGLTSTSYTPVLEAGKKYFWKVAALDNKGGVTESDTWQFTTTTHDVGITNLRVYYRYTDPTSIYNFESSALNPAFNTNTLSYAARGRTTIKDAIAIVLDYTDPNTVVTVDLPPSFTSTTNIIYNNGLPSNATKYIQVEGNFATHNVIKIRLQNGAITREYTIDAQINQKPTIPVLQQPANGTTNAAVQPTFEWTGGDDADGNMILYRLFIGSSATLSTNGASLNKKSITPLNPLAGAQKYYWKITATDSDNETVESAIHSFVTQAIPLSVPELQYPREISTYVEPNITLAWKFNDAPGITYDIYLDKNPSPQRIAQGITGNTYSIQNLAHNTTYYWKVVAVNAQGVVTGSKTNRFITKPANGNETGTFTDIRDGEIYQWVQINGLRWMTHNLAYRPQARDGYFDYDYFNISGTTKSYAALSNNNQNITKYGYLYNWEAAMNFDSETDTGASKQGVCPCGWRVATPADWQKLAPLNTDIPSYVHHSTWTIPGKEYEWLNASGLSMLPSGLYNTQAWPAAFQTNAFQFWLANNRLSNKQAGYSWLNPQNRFFPISNGSAGFASVRCVKNDNNNHAPGKPALQAPLNNSTQTNYNMLLQWTPATDADGDAITYNLYVDTLPDPVQCIQTGITGTSYQHNGLQQGKTYYWKVSARDLHGEIAESDIWSFAMQPGNNTPPAAVQLLLPAHGGTGVNASSVTLTWAAATDADGDVVSYNLYFGNQQATLPLIATNISGTAYTLTALDNSTQYFWKVVAIDGQGGVTESTVNNFTTLNHAPTAPVLLSPANGLVGMPKEIVLAWNRSTDPDGDQVYYRIMVGTDPAALSSRGDVSGTTHNFGGPATLQNTIYYWQIIASDHKGGETASEIRQFTTFRNEFPGLGILPVTPGNKSTGVCTTPFLSWTKPVNNMLYDVYVGTSYTHHSLVAESLTDTPFVLNHINGAALTPHTAYYWKVVPKDALGNTHAADVWQFTTRNNTPDKPQLSAPANNAAAQPYSVSLNWLPVTDADGDLVLYDVYLGNNANPSTPIASGLQQTNFTTALLTPNATCYWKVVAKDAFGGTIASDEYSFTVQNNSQNTAPAAPQLTSPLAYESGVSNTAVLQWNTAFDIDGDALVYDVYISTSQVWGAPVATGISSLQYTTTALTHGITWYWKVVARDNKGGETASAVWNFTVKNNAPSAPVPLTPVMGEVQTGTSASLTWAAATDPENDAIVYDVYLDKNAQPETLLAKGVTTLNYNTPAIDNNGVYYWQVIARDALGAATAGPVYTFTGKNEAPSAPVLQLPANNNNITTVTATLTWQASTDTDSDPPGYDVYIGSSAAALQRTGTVFTNNFTTGTLTAGTTYYWKVVARDQQQSTTESAVWSFTVQPIAPNQPPAAPQLVSPANQSVNVPVQQTQFSWTAAIDPEADPVKYDLYVSINAQAETRIAADINSVNYTLNNLVANTTYYWKVVAKDDHGNTTASSIYEFTTVALQPVTYVISGKIADAQGAGVAGVLLKGLPGNIVTGSTGEYSITVSPGFSGSVTPELTGYEFEPKQRTLSNVQTDLVAQHFTATMVTGTIDTELDRAIQISPNPTSGHIVITLPELLHSWHIELYTANGHKQFSRTVNGYVRKQELVIQVKGIFFIRLTNDRKTVVRKIVVL